MLSVASNDAHRELEEIVADLPPTATVVNGPASISQHAPTCKINCSNPDDLSRVKSFKHYQDYVINVTKDGIYFVVDKLERMFPENATRTKVLLGSLSAIQILKDNGATVSVDASEGTLLKIPLESIPGSFQDPFFACDPPPPLLPRLPNPLAGLYPSPSSSFARSLSPSSTSSIGPPSGLLVGANVKVGFWQTLFQGKLNVWQALTTAGTKVFFNGLIIGFVDEILGSLVPLRYKNRLNYIKNLLKGASALIGTSVLVYMLANKQTQFGTAIVSVLISYVCNLLGGAVGSALGKLFQWVQRNYFAEGNVRSDDVDAECGFAHAPLPTHVDLRGATNPATYGEVVHCCGQESNGFMHIGLCINCNIQPAVFGFVHSKDNVAHSAFCLPCSAMYRKSTCVCCAEVSSTYYFSPGTPTCNARTCLAVAPCVTCDENGVELPKTASVWRLKKSEETQVTHRTVTLDVRYCRDHFPVASHSDVFRYGRLFSTGYM
eukprot:Phypoly_transcript_07781.p1 GENE.Phypoly_transcript_07781~~Phypoly_transcript_07781.p1  ORF type:complete len:491 (+),score=50.13 Phypoly_transcript_07781:71-1543(+)